MAEEAPNIAQTAKTLSIASKLSDRSQWSKLPQSSLLGLPLPVAPDGSFRGQRRASSVKRSTRRGSRCINPRDASSKAAKKRSSSAATNKRCSQKKGQPRITYRALPACYPRHRHRRTKGGVRSNPSSLGLPRRIIPREITKVSHRSESASRQAAFLFPRDAVSNAYLKATSRSSPL